MLISLFDQDMTILDPKSRGLVLIESKTRSWKIRVEQECIGGVQARRPKQDFWVSLGCPTAGCENVQQTSRHQPVNDVITAP